MQAFSLDGVCLGLTPIDSIYVSVLTGYVDEVGQGRLENQIVNSENGEVVESDYIPFEEGQVGGGLSCNFLAERGVKEGGLPSERDGKR